MVKFLLKNRGLSLNLGEDMRQSGEDMAQIVAKTCYTDGHEYVDAFWGRRRGAHAPLLCPRTPFLLVGFGLCPGMCSFLALWLACWDLAVRSGRGDLGARSFPTVVVSSHPQRGENPLSLICHLSLPVSSSDLYP